MRRHCARLAALALSVLLVAGCDGGGSGSGVRTAGEIELTREQPIMAIEFEASFESLARSSGIYARLDQIRPDSPDDLSGVKALRREFWDGEAWVPNRIYDAEITGLGVNTFRFRWILEIADDTSEATIPFEAEINPTFGDLFPPPEEDDVTGLMVSVTSIYPLDSN